MASFGIKISKTGYDAKSLTSGSINLVLDTEAKTLKLKLSGDSDGGSSIAHGMGEVPIHLMYDSDSSNGVRRISTPFSTVYGHANSTNIVVANGQYTTTKYLVFYPS